MAVVLLVDPSQTIRRVVEMVLKASGHDVVAAGSAAEGRQALARYQPAVVLLNYVLPDGSGVRLCQAIKGDPATGHLPVIVLGGTYAPFERSEAVAAGADAVVMKPFETAQLLSPVLELIGRGGGARASAPQAGPAAGPAAHSRPPADPGASGIPRPPLPTAGAAGGRHGSTPAPVPRPPQPAPQVPRPPAHQPPAPVPPPPQAAPHAPHAPHAPPAPPAPQAHTAPVAHSASQPPPIHHAPAAPVAVDPAQVRQIVEDLLPQIAIDTLQQMLADWLEARLRNYIYELVQQEFSRYR